MSGCFSRRNFATSLHVLVYWSSGRRHPPPLSFGCLTDGLPHLTHQHCAVVSLVFILVLLLSSTSGPAIPGSTLCLHVPDQARLKTSLPEVHLPTNPSTNFPGSAYVQRLCENDVGEDEGPLVVTTPSKNPPSFRSQYIHKPAQYFSRGCGLPVGQLCGQPAPSTLPNSIFQDSPIHVRPVVGMQEVFLESLQQQVRTFRGKARQFRTFLQKGHANPPPPPPPPM